MKPTTIASLQKCKQDKKRFATITAYDYSFAKLFADEGINVMLVGDSLGMTVQGHDSTLPVTVADIAYHTAAVRRGAPNCLLLADLPFMAYATPEQAFENAATVMRAGANMVKIEGGEWLVETVQMLTERAVPVCGHLGLTPQSVNIFGGYKVQGRGDEAGDRLLSDALALEAAGLSIICTDVRTLTSRLISTNTATQPSKSITLCRCTHITATARTDNVSAIFSMESHVRVPIKAAMAFRLLLNHSPPAIT